MHTSPDGLKDATLRFLSETDNITATLATASKDCLNLERDNNVPVRTDDLQRVL